MQAMADVLVRFMALFHLKHYEKMPDVPGFRSVYYSQTSNNAEQFKTVPVSGPSILYLRFRARLRLAAKRSPMFSRRTEGPRVLGFPPTGKFLSMLKSTASSSSAELPVMSKLQLSLYAVAQQN